jgi:hypothetical protein
MIDSLRTWLTAGPPRAPRANAEELEDEIRRRLYGARREVERLGRQPATPHAPRPSSLHLVQRAAAPEDQQVHRRLHT